MSTLSFSIPGTPIPQARSRHRVVKLRSGATFVGQYDPAKSRNWKGVVAEFSAKAMAGRTPLEGPIVLEAVFVFLPTASWPKYRLGLLDACIEMAKITKPDLDNLLKGVVDGMSGIVFRDDGQVWRYAAKKIYGTRAEVRITVTATEEGLRKAETLRTTADGLPF